MRGASDRFERTVRARETGGLLGAEEPTEEDGTGEEEATVDEAEILDESLGSEDAAASGTDGRLLLRAGSP